LNSLEGNMKGSTCRRVLLSAALAAISTVLIAAPLEAQTRPFAWSTVASAGTVDEASTSLVLLDAGSVGFRPTAPAGSVAVIRYPLSSLPSGSAFFNPPVGYEVFYSYVRLVLTLSFRKNDDNAYAAAAVKRVRLADGQTNTVAGVNSLAYFPGGDVQHDERIVGCSAPPYCYAPAEYAYFVEVVIWKPQATSDPKVVGVRVHLGY
jgi:hypothetical protein